jgi:FdhD protein
LFVKYYAINGFRMSDKQSNLRPDPNRPIEFIQVETGRPEARDGDVIVEMPVALTINGEVWLTFMCTPVDLEAMAVGFLYNENVIQTIEEVADVHVCAAGDNIDVWLAHPAEKPDRWRRTSGCTGGVTSVDVAAAAYGEDQAAAPVSINGQFTPQQIGKLVDALFESQSLYRISGGVHTSALSDGQQVLLACEDIGRHNTLDKLAGRLLLDHIQTTQRVLLTTGRISSEMMQKASRLDAALVISRTSPSSLSIELARRWGITLIGYARRHRFNIYTYPERIVGI